MDRSSRDRRTACNAISGPGRSMCLACWCAQSIPLPMARHSHRRKALLMVIVRAWTRGGEERGRNQGAKDFRGSKSGTSSNADGKLSEWEEQRIAAAGEMLLEYMLFRNEAPLKRSVEGTSGFAAEFQRGGPLDAKGRSL